LARVQGPRNPGLGALVPQDLADGRGRCIGRLWASAPGGPALALVAGQIQLLVGMKLEQAEQRTRPRGPSGSSFVPGLVHELRNFIFGISGSLDAFHARFAAQEEVAKYETVMRTSLGRLNLFMDELADYGDPKPPSWTDRDLGFLLKEAIEYEKPRAAAEGVTIRLELEAPLPPVKADEQNLVMAFIRMIDLALGQRGSGGQVTVQAEAVRAGARPLIRGYVESSHLKLPEVDLARLFEPFYYRASGFGRLALPVARRILENHGGSLTAALGPGGRIRMAFTLPALLDDLRG
jgi:signal transduction histidine kinase